MKKYPLPSRRHEVARALESVLRDGDLVGDGQSNGLVESLSFERASVWRFGHANERTESADLCFRRETPCGDFDFEVACLNRLESLGLFGAKGEPVVQTASRGGCTVFRVAFRPRIVSREQGLNILTEAVRREAIDCFELMVAEPSTAVAHEK